MEDVWVENGWADGRAGWDDGPTTERRRGPPDERTKAQLIAATTFSFGPPHLAPESLLFAVIVLFFFSLGPPSPPPSVFGVLPLDSQRLRSSPKFRQVREEKRRPFVGAWRAGPTWMGWLGGLR